MAKKEKSMESKLLIAGVVGGVAGLILGAFIWGNKDGENPISDKLKSITSAIQQLEGINTNEANSLMKKLKGLLLDLNEKHEKSEE
jgi:uncharacterized protein YoxC